MQLTDVIRRTSPGVEIAVTEQLRIPLTGASTYGKACSSSFSVIAHSQVYKETAVAHRHRYRYAETWLPQTAIFPKDLLVGCLGTESEKTIWFGTWFRREESVGSCEIVSIKFSSTNIDPAVFAQTPFPKCSINSTEPSQEIFAAEYRAHYDPVTPTSLP
jgi:hypothetical protein